MNRNIIWLSTLMLAALLLSACSGLIPASGVEPVKNAATQQAEIEQAVVGTATAIAMQAEIERLQTQVAQGGAASDTAVPPTATAPLMEVTPLTATATNVPATATSIPTATAVPTNTPLPPTPTAVIPTQTAIPLPTLAPTATPIPCNMATFVKDVTIPDGSILAAGSNFTKTWQLRNTGSCTWTTAYDVVFVSGDAMSAPAAVDLPGSVAPGQVIDIPIKMVAPGSEGSYRGNWKLRDSNGVIFGLGSSSATFYVDIRVPSKTGSYPLDMVAAMCQAEWTSGAGRLDCPSPDSDSRGFVFRVDKPTLESGYIDDEPALVTHPQMVSDGFIRGKFPAMKVESGQKFSAIVGCTRGATGCDVRFQLDYQINDGAIQSLAAWNESYDEMYTPVSVDLSPLAGNNVRFILTVLANGSATGDRAQWLAPRISK